MKILIAGTVSLMLYLAGVSNSQAESFAKIEYGDHPTSFGELTVPKGDGPHPVAILVHGGCWKSNWGSTTNYRPMAQDFVANGIAVWNIEYRRLGHSGGGWPGTFLDLGSALDFLEPIGESHSLDLERVVALGHSSGGHFVAWLASRPLLATDSEIRGKASVHLSGVVITDAFIDPLVLRSFGTNGEIYCGEPLLEQLMGGDPETHPEYLRQISPMEWLPWGIPQEYVVSSFRYPVSPPRPLAGGRTTMVMPDYPKMARNAGDEINVVVVPDAEHLGFYEPSNTSYREVVSAVLRIVNKLQ